MSEPQVLLFDIGGVVLTNGWDQASRALAKVTFELDEGFEARHDALARALDCGSITLDGYLDRVVFDRPQRFDRREFLSFMRAQSRPHPEVLAILDELAAAGRYVIASLNNESAELNRYRIDRFELTRYFDVFLSSCYLGVAKPDPAIYLRALDLLQRSAGACVFVDDRSENVAAALQLGLVALEHPGPARLELALRDLGVRVG